MRPERYQHDDSPENGRPAGLSLDSVAEMACEIALHDGGHVPTVIAEGTRNTLLGSFPELPPTHQERVEMMQVAGQLLGQREAVGFLKQVYFISEAWMCRGSRPGMEAVQPSKDPERVEVLVVAGLQVVARRSALRLYEMIRDETGDLAELRAVTPDAEGEGQVESPLLTAFVAGYLVGVWRRAH